MIDAALIPLRSLTEGKQRLREVLSAADRARLVQQLFARTYRALHESGVVGHVAVISPDPALLDWARQWNVQPIVQADRGLNAGLEHGRRVLLAERSPRSLLIILPDLPCVTPHDIRAIGQSIAPNSVALATDRDGTGTNALLIDPATTLPFQFGGGSLARHRAASTLR